MQAAANIPQRIGQWIESPRIQSAIIVLIVINAVILGLETDADIMARYGHALLAADKAILAVFVLEILLKLYAFRLQFFRNPWSVFDFVIIAIALVPSGGGLDILRALRILRVLRLVSMLPQLRLVVEALLKAVPGIASVAGLMLLLFYVFAVIATTLYGGHFPQWFGSIGASMYTLFQIMTLESWSMGIVRPVMQVYPHAWAFFVPFILIATFTMLNLFIGIIVDTMQTMHEATHAQERKDIEATMHADTNILLREMQAMKNELADLRRGLGQHSQ